MRARRRTFPFALAAVLVLSPLVSAGAEQLEDAVPLAREISTRVAAVRHQNLRPVDDGQSAAAFREAAGPAAPAFTLKDLSGKDVSSTSFRGKAVLLDFSATWCAPCSVAMPFIRELQRKFSGEGFTVVRVNDAEEPAKVAAFFARTEPDLDYPVLVDVIPPGAENPKVFSAYKAGGFPTFVLLDAAGREVWRHEAWADPANPQETQALHDEFVKEVVAALPLPKKP
jgi:thiol-disulfide isomerase/thioredoxin